MKSMYDPLPLATQGQLNDTEWQEIQLRSEAGEISIPHKCPVCLTKITPFPDGGYGCQTCQKVADVFFIRENADDEVKVVENTSIYRILKAHCNVSEVHAFYMQVAGHRQLLRRVELVCLSCGQPSRKIQLQLYFISGGSCLETYYCSENCGIRTYYQLRYESDGFFLVPSFECHLLYPKDDPLEIPEGASGIAETSAEPVTGPPSRPLSPAETPDTHPSLETDPTANDSQTNPFDIHAPINQKTDIEGQILKYLKQAPHNTATTREMITAFGCSRNGFNKAKDNLIENRRIRQIKRGIYELINP